MHCCLYDSYFAVNKLLLDIPKELRPRPCKSLRLAYVLSHPCAKSAHEWGTLFGGGVSEKQKQEQPQDLQLRPPRGLRSG